MKGLTVGILVGDRLYRGIPKGNTGYERIPLYEEGARACGLVPVYFRLRDANVATGAVKALVLENGAYAAKTIELPRVIHNRAIYSARRAHARLDRLIARTGAIVFNRRNRYGKWRVHRLLMEDEAMRPHLPETQKATAAAIRKLTRRYPAVIVKPCSGSIGRGVMKLERDRGRWRLAYPRDPRRSRVRWRTIERRGAVPSALTRAIRGKPYIVQQRLPLAEYNGNPFDLRVSVQRDGTGAFQVTGIAAKVAKAGAFVTNVAQGGAVYRLEDVVAGLPGLDPSEVRSSVSAFALAAAARLGERLPALADIGFDVGIAEDGFPMFIEMNLRDQRYSFREAGLHEEWRRTYANPMAYAKYLLEGGAPDGSGAR